MTHNITLTQTQLDELHGLLKLVEHFVEDAEDGPRLSSLAFLSSKGLLSEKVLYAARELRAHIESEVA